MRDFSPYPSLQNSPEQWNSAWPQTGSGSATGVGWDAEWCKRGTFMIFSERKVFSVDSSKEVILPHTRQLRVPHGYYTLPRKNRFRIAKWEVEPWRCEVRGNSDNRQCWEQGCPGEPCPAWRVQVETLQKHCIVPQTKQNPPLGQFQPISSSWFLVRGRDDQTDTASI